MPKNWNRRFKYNREKIKTGDIFEIAEVVRNLAIREMDKGLSTGEKQMYTRAKKILASEFMYALEKDEEGAEEYIDGLLEERFSEGDRLAKHPRMGADALATAVIAAAGSGDRLGAGGPKALVEVGGRPLLAWSLAAIADADRIGSVVVSAPPGHEEEVRAIAGDASVVTGGASRSESVALALELVESELVAVHDAARPLATPRLFDAVVVRARGRPRVRRGGRGGAGRRHAQARAWRAG